MVHNANADINALYTDDSYEAFCYSVYSPEDYSLVSPLQILNPYELNVDVINGTLYKDYKYSYKVPDLADFLYQYRMNRNPSILINPAEINDIWISPGHQKTTKLKLTSEQKYRLIKSLKRSYQLSYYESFVGIIISETLPYAGALVNVVDLFKDKTFFKNGVIHTRNDYDTIISHIVVGGEIIKKAHIEKADSNNNFHFIQSVLYQVKEGDEQHQILLGYSRAVLGYAGEFRSINITPLSISDQSTYLINWNLEGVTLTEEDEKKVSYEIKFFQPSDNTSFQKTITNEYSACFAVNINNKKDMNLATEWCYLEITATLNSEIIATSELIDFEYMPIGECSIVAPPTSPNRVVAQ